MRTGSSEWGNFQTFTPSNYNDAYQTAAECGTANDESSNDYL